MAGRSRNVNVVELATATSFVAVLMVVVVAAMAQGVQSATTVITNNLPVDASFVLYNDDDVVFPTRTAHTGQQVSWNYDTSRSQFYRVFIRADEPTHGLQVHLQTWSRTEFAGIPDPHTFFKVDDTGLYAQNTPNSAWNFVGPWQIID